MLGEKKRSTTVLTAFPFKKIIIFIMCMHVCPCVGICTEVQVAGESSDPLQLAGTGGQEPPRVDAGS